MYLKVICSLKAYQNQKLIICHSVENITDLNLVTRHILHVCVNEQFRTKGSLPTPADKSRPSVSPYAFARGQENNSYAPNIGGYQQTTNENFMSYGGFLANQAGGNMPAGFGGGYLDSYNADDKIINQLKSIALGNPRKTLRTLDFQRVLGQSGKGQVGSMIQSLLVRGVIIQDSDTEYSFISI